MIQVSKVIRFVSGQLYFVQNGIKIASKDNEGKTYLFGVMDRLEQVTGYLFLLFIILNFIL